MVGSCAVLTCKVTNRNYKEKKCSFHRFPKEKSLSLIWLNRCKRKDKINLSNAVICSKHFELFDFEVDKINRLLNKPERHILKPGVLPTLNLPNQTHNQKENGRLRQSNQVFKQNELLEVEHVLVSQKTRPKSKDVEIQTKQTCLDCEKQILENMKLKIRLQDSKRKERQLTMRMKAKDEKYKKFYGNLSKIFATAQLKKLHGMASPKSNDLLKILQNQFEFQV